MADAVRGWMISQQFRKTSSNEKNLNKVSVETRFLNDLQVSTRTKGVFAISHARLRIHGISLSLLK